MDRAKVVFAFLFPLLVGLCLYRLSSAPTRVSALSMGPPASKTRAIASQAVCLREPRFKDGPPASKTGAPGEGTCHDCHNTYDINDPSGSVTIDGLPGSYVAGGDPIAFTVTVSQDGTNRANIDWGFEITVLDANNVFAGTLVVTDDTNTQSDSGDVDGSTRFYIKQTSDGIFYNPDGADHATWSMTWVPPDTDVGPVTFYVAGNAGNGDGTRSGDYIFLNNQTVLGPGGNFVAHALPLSDLRSGPKAVWLPRSARAPRSAPLN